MAADGGEQYRDTGVKTVIIYDDRRSGLRAKRFADRMSLALEEGRRCPDRLWRAEMLQFPTLAMEAASDAADADFILVSLRGDQSLPCTVRSWLEAEWHEWEPNPPAIVAMFDATTSKRPAVEGTRQYFRSLADQLGTTFFSHTVSTTPAEAAREAC